jgi:hypothetical protein
MRLDTDCDVVIDSGHEENITKVDEIAHIRTSLLAEHVGESKTSVDQMIEKSGSLIGTIEALRLRTNRLRPYQLPEVNDVAAWLAENEILDPEGPDEMFESPTNRGLYRRRRFGRKKII